MISFSMTSPLVSCKVTRRKRLCQWSVKRLMIVSWCLSPQLLLRLAGFLAWPARWFPNLSVATGGTAVLVTVMKVHEPSSCLKLLTTSMIYLCWRRFGWVMMAPHLRATIIWSSAQLWHGYLRLLALRAASLPTLYGFSWWSGRFHRATA